jgi:hypothetical protein
MLPHTTSGAIPWLQVPGGPFVLLLRPPDGRSQSQALAYRILAAMVILKPPRICPDAADIDHILQHISMPAASLAPGRRNPAATDLLQPDGPGGAGIGNTRQIGDILPGKTAWEERRWTSPR